MSNNERGLILRSVRNIVKSIQDILRQDVGVDGDSTWSRWHAPHSAIATSPFTPCRLMAVFPVGIG